MYRQWSEIAPKNCCEILTTFTVLKPLSPGGKWGGKGPRQICNKGCAKQIFLTFFSLYNINVWFHCLGEETSRISTNWGSRYEQKKGFCQKPSLSTIPRRWKRFGGYLGHLHCGGCLTHAKDPPSNFRVFNETFLTDLSIFWSSFQCPNNAGTTEQGVSWQHKTFRINPQTNKFPGSLFLNLVFVAKFSSRNRFVSLSSLSIESISPLLLFRSPGTLKVKRCSKIRLTFPDVPR